MRAPSRLAVLPGPSPRARAGRGALATGIAIATILGSTRAAGADPAPAPPPPSAPPAPASRIYQVPSGAMAPTIAVGQNIRVSLFPRSESLRPTIGSIVVTHPPRGADRPQDPRPEGACAVADALHRGMPCPRSTGGRWAGELYVKRIVAGPGDTVAVHDGYVVRNGTRLDEPYVAPTCRPAAGPSARCEFPRPIRLPRNRYFLMGDNRGESNDSRFWGPVPRAWMVGVVTQIDVPAPRLLP